MSERFDTPPPLDDARSLITSGTFEDALDALQAVVDHLERGKLTLAETLTWYEVGLGLSRRCGQLLEQAELQIGILEQTYGMIGEREIDWDDDEA
ncbi:MAG: exodeoxyribonuclease VII small subunit [Thermomicrobiales bacterium]